MTANTLGAVIYAVTTNLLWKIGSRHSQFLSRALQPITTPPKVNGFLSPYFDYPGLGPEIKPLNGFILPLDGPDTSAVAAATERPRPRPTWPVLIDRDDVRHPPTFAPPSTFALPPIVQNAAFSNWRASTAAATSTTVKRFVTASTTTTTTTTTTTSTTKTYTTQTRTTTTTRTTTLPYSSLPNYSPIAAYSSQRPISYSAATPTTTITTSTATSTTTTTQAYNDLPSYNSNSNDNNKAKSYPISPSIMEVLRLNDLTVLSTLLEESGLNQMLNQKSYGAFTVFAPTDSAFNKYFQSSGGVVTGIENLKRNTTEIKRVSCTPCWTFKPKLLRLI